MARVQFYRLEEAFLPKGLYGGVFEGSEFSFSTGRGDGLLLRQVSVNCSAEQFE
jgi:hypothetical protein